MLLVFPPESSSCGIILPRDPRSVVHHWPGLPWPVAIGALSLFDGNCGLGPGVGVPGIGELGDWELVPLPWPSGHGEFSIGPLAVHVAVI